jgi:hypothetical protein
VNWVDLWGLDPVNTYSLRRVLSSQDPRNTKKTTYENRYYSTDDQAIGELRNIHYLQIKNRQMDQTTQITEIVKIDSSELSPEIANRLGPGIIVHERINNGVQENISTLHRESPGKFSLCSK